MNQSDVRANLEEVMQLATELNTSGSTTDDNLSTKEALSTNRHAKRKTGVTMWSNRSCSSLDCPGNAAVSMPTEMMNIAQSNIFRLAHSP